tara:strand:- start:21556 stop:23436 length:1881 start_codon:yes stop_codon:yes gene_type:complete
MTESLEDNPSFEDYWYNAKYDIGTKSGKLKYPTEYFDFDELQLGIDPNEVVEDYEEYVKIPGKIEEEWLRCANSFAYFAMKYIRIIHPIDGLVRFIIYTYQKEVISNYESHRFSIVSKFRQGGLTTLTTIWALWRCMFKLDEQIMCMSKSDREAIKAGENVTVALNNLPNWLKPALGKDNDHIKAFEETGARLEFWGPSAARGQSLTWFIIDEAAFVEGMDKAWRAMYPTISTGGSCVAISTVNGIGNWYEETYKGALDKRNKFNVIDLDYHSHPDYNDDKWVLDTKAQLGPKGWMQEIEKQFLGSGDTYFSLEVLQRADDRTKFLEPIRKLFPEYNNLFEIRNEITNPDFERGALHVFEECLDGREYVMGVDVAEGVGDEGDSSCIQVVDATTYHQVAEFYSNSASPHVFSQVVSQIGNYYNNALCVVENMAAGVAVLSRLQHELFYENLFYENPGKNNRAGVKTTSANRPAILEALQSRLIADSFKVNSRRLSYEMSTFLFNPLTKKAEATKGKHDDAIMAASLALYVLNLQNRNIPVGAEVPKEVVSAFSSDIYEEIKAELARDKPEDWFEEEPDDIFGVKEDDVMSGVMFDIKRQHDDLLREFGWAFVPPVLLIIETLNSLF